MVSPTFPQVTSGSLNVEMRRGTDRQIDTQMAVTNIHFASATPHAKYDQLFNLPLSSFRMHTNLTDVETLIIVIVAGCCIQELIRR